MRIHRKSKIRGKCDENSTKSATAPFRRRKCFNAQPQGDPELKGGNQTLPIIIYDRYIFNPSKNMLTNFLARPTLFWRLFWFMGMWLINYSSLNTPEAIILRWIHRRLFGRSLRSRYTAEAIPSYTWSADTRAGRSYKPAAIMIQSNTESLRHTEYPAIHSQLGAQTEVP